MVFETLGPSLYDYVKANEYRPVPLYALQAFADQLLASVAFLHEMQLVHTDLKVRRRRGGGVGGTGRRLR